VCAEKGKKSTWNASELCARFLEECSKAQSGKKEFMAHPENGLPRDSVTCTINHHADKDIKAVYRTPALHLPCQHSNAKELDNSAYPIFHLNSA